MTPEMFRGAVKSRTVWWNVFLAVLASFEMFAGNLTQLFGQEVAASILLAGALTNIILRTITTEALAEKK